MTDQNKTGGYENILADGDTHTLIEGELAKYGAGFKGYERPRNFDLLAEEYGEDLVQEVLAIHPDTSDPNLTRSV
mgnify:CR=1 FL=1